jgi:mono/diheme cytochrome c family protein
MRAAVLLSVLLALAACDRLPGRPLPSERPDPAARAGDFTLVYGSHCAGCHGDASHLGAAVSLADPVYLALIDDATLARVTRQGVAGTGMPPFALSDREIDTIVRGIRSRWAHADALGEATAPPYAAAPGDAARGARAYATYCASCHGADGGGGAKGGSVVDPAYLALVSQQGLRTAILVGRPQLGMPDWRGGGTRAPMTDEEIADVVAWLWSQREERPGA